VSRRVGLAGMPRERLVERSPLIPTTFLRVFGIFVVNWVMVFHFLGGQSLWHRSNLVLVGSWLAMVLGVLVINKAAYAVAERSLRVEMESLEQIGYDFKLDTDVGLVEIRNSGGGMVAVASTAVAAVLQALEGGKIHEGSLPPDARLLRQCVAERKKRK
jgi:hypothetical protein